MNTLTKPFHPPEELAPFSVITTVPVQWGDMDAFGHVNNVVYIRWFESARIDLLAALPECGVSMQPGGIGPILAAVQCDFKRQMTHPDTACIGSRVAAVGRTSVEIEHSVFSLQQREFTAAGKSVMVVFDYAANRPVRVPEQLRKVLEDSSGSGSHSE